MLVSHHFGTVSDIWWLTINVLAECPLLVNLLYFCSKAVVRRLLSSRLPVDSCFICAFFSGIVGRGKWEREISIRLPIGWQQLGSPVPGLTFLQNILERRWGRKQSVPQCLLPEKQLDSIKNWTANVVVQFADWAHIPYTAADVRKQQYGVTLWSIELEWAEFCKNHCFQHHSWEKRR